MPEEEKKDKEGLAVGRILGVIAKKRPDLYERIRRRMELEGAKATDVIVEALEVYSDMMDFSAIDIRSLFATLRLLERIGSWMFETMGNYLRLISSVTYVPMEEEEEEREEPRRSGVPPEIRAKIAEAVTPLLTSLLTTFISTISNYMTSMAQRQTGIQPSIVAQQQPKIEVPMPRVVVGKKPEEKKEVEEEISS